MSAPFSLSHVHHGLAQEKWRRRADALAAVYAAHPEHFPNGMPTLPR